jgi:putative phosphotransacetylase
MYGCRNRAAGFLEENSMSKKFIIETSARHLHVTQEDLEILFGKGATLTHKKDLSQPGQFACEERVTVVGPKKELAGVSILGPVRPETQVELSATDARSIGIAAPIRESGDVAGSGACKLVGPCGEVELTQGVIVAKRHIHLTPEDAEELGVVDKEVVWVKCDTDGRKAILGDVVCRVSKSYARAMHIDTDESNAIGAGRELEGEIIKL